MAAEKEIKEENRMSNGGGNKSGIKYKKETELNYLRFNITFMQINKILTF